MKFAYILVCLGLLILISCGKKAPRWECLEHLPEGFAARPGTMPPSKYDPFHPRSTRSYYALYDIRDENQINTITRTLVYREGIFPILSKRGERLYFVEIKQSKNVLVVHDLNFHKSIPLKMPEMTGQITGFHELPSGDLSVTFSDGSNESVDVSESSPRQRKR